MKNFIISLGCFVLFSAATLTLRSQTSWEIINTASTSQGLMSDEVLSLKFTPDGTMWCATNLGLATYKDGQWMIFGVDKGLEVNKEVTNLYIGPSGNVWACTKDQGLIKYAPDGTKLATYKSIEGDPNSLNSNEIASVVEDEKGGVYVANSGDGNVLTYIAPDGTFKQFASSIFGTNPFNLIISLAYYPTTHKLYAGFLFDGIRVYDGNLWQLLDGQNQPATEIEVAPDGTLYAATDVGLYIHDGNSSKILTTDNGLPDNFLKSVAIDGNGEVWVGSDGAGAAHRKADGSWEVFNASNGLSSNDIYSIAFNSDNHPYFGTHIGGISYQDSQSQWQHLGASGLAANNVNDIYFQSPDSVWYATADGLSLHAKKLWFNTKFHEENGDGFASNQCGTIIQDLQSPNILWMSSNQGGIIKYNKEYQSNTYYKIEKQPMAEGENPTSPYLNLYQAPNGDLWVTTFGSDMGIGKVNKADGKVTFYRDADISVLPPKTNSFFCAVTAPDGSTWFCSVAGVLILKDGQFRFEKFPTKIKARNPQTGEIQETYDNNVRNVAFDRSGKAWISKISGIVIYDLSTGEKKQELGPQKAPISIATEIAFDEEQNAYIGTLVDGLYIRTSDGKYYHVDDRFGLDAKIKINRVLFHDNRLYLLTDKGVYIQANFKQMVKDIVAGVKNIHPDVRFQLYPNPTIDRLILPMQCQAYEVYTTSGLLLLKGKIASEIDLSSLTADTYIVRCLFGGKWMTEKIIKR